VSKTETIEDPNDIHQNDRGDGTTTRQLKASPEKAIYVLPTMGAYPYTRDLAHNLGRDDIEFVSSDFFRDNRWRGLKKSRIVIDRATPQSMSFNDRVYMYNVLEQMHD
jgi:hypothetical protein